MKLFTERIRTDLGPSRHSEAKYQYLDRSARPAFIRIRSIIENWFGNYPEDHKADWKQRFCVDDDVGHLSAFLELYCFTLCKAHGFTVVVHPDRSPIDKRAPDFKLLWQGRDFCYFEVAAVFGDEMSGAERTLDGVHDRVEELELRNWFVNPLVRRSNHQAPSITSLIKSINDLANAHCPDQVIATGVLPEIQFESNGWSINVNLIPKKPEARLPDRRCVGLTSTARGACWVDTNRDIYSKLKKKANRYKELELPLLIAVSCYDPIVDDEEYRLAMVGAPLLDGRSVSLSENREPSLWLGPQGLQNSRVCAVLQIDAVMPWTIGSARGMLWHRPSSENDELVKVWRTPQFRFDKSLRPVPLSAGQAPQLLMGLPADLLFDE